MLNRPTICGVQVHTWGTRANGGSGVLVHLKKMLYGGNVGHVAMTLTIPDNEEGKRLIEQYCFDYEENAAIIPYKKRKVNFSDGSFEKVYEVYFSAWPSKELTDTFFMEDDIDKDNLGFLYGENFDWRENFRDSREHYEKIVTGLIAKRKISRGPVTIAHYGTKNIFNNDEKKVLSILARNVKLNEDLKSLKILIKKLKACSPTHPFINSDSNRLLIKNALSGKKHDFDEFLIKRVLGNEDVDMLKRLAEKRIGWCNSNIYSNKQKIKRTFPKKHDVDNMKKYLSSGTASSGLVSLPIDNKIASNVGVGNGLDVEEMLLQMHDLVTGNASFNLHDQNCSELVSKVLEAGISQQHLKAIVARRTIFGINNPQTMHDVSIKVKKGIINNEKTNIWHKVKYLNPATPFEKLMKLLIKSAYDNHYLLGFVIIPILILLVSSLVIKAIVWPLNILGGFLANEPRVSVVNRDKAAADIVQTGLTGTELHERKIMDSELTEQIDLKIEQIDVIKPDTAILDFAIVLKNPELIPVFANTGIDKLKKYISNHSTTPEGMKDGIIGLELPLPKNLDYNNLRDLVDELQLLSAQRVTANVKQLHDIIKNRKTTVTQFGTTLGNPIIAHDANKTKDTPSVNPKGG